MNTLILISLKIFEIQLLGCVLVGLWYFLIGLSRLTHFVWGTYDWGYEDWSDKLFMGIATLFLVGVGGFFLYGIVYVLYLGIGDWINLNQSLINLF